MKKGKLFTVLVALVLAAVGAFVAVTSVLSAQNQYVTSTLNVTYTANNVSATVEVKSRVGSSGNFAGTGTYSHTFYPADGNAESATLTTAPATLGFTSASDETFDEYVIYQFKFQNNYTGTQGCPLYVTMTDSFANYGSETVNVIRAYQSRTDATIPGVSISRTNNIATTIGGDGNWVTTPPSGVAVAVGAQPTVMYIYMVVAIKDQTKPISGYSNNAISFALSSTNS